MINRFIKDLKIDQIMQPIPYNSGYSEVLDLSRRRDSVETRKTPSPYTTSSSYEGGSPNMEEPSPAALSSSPRTSSEHSMPYTTSTTYLPDNPAHRNHPIPMYYYQPPQMDHREDAPKQHSQPHLPYQSQHSIENKSNLIHPFDIIKTAAALHQQMSRSPAKSPSTEPADSKLEQSLPVNHHPVNHSLPPLIYSKMINREGKIARPFKAYPRDPLAMAATFTATDALLDTQKAEKYSVFRKRMLDQIHASNGGHATISNPKMRRNGNSGHAYNDDQANDSSSSGNEEHSQTESSNSPGTINQNGVLKDAAYFERRKKNNAAAKKSRDRRRIKEDEIAVRAAFLEHENIELRIELASIKNQLAMFTANSSR